MLLDYGIDLNYFDTEKYLDAYMKSNLLNSISKKIRFMRKYPYDAAYPDRTKLQHIRKKLILQNIIGTYNLLYNVDGTTNSFYTNKPGSLHKLYPLLIDLFLQYGADPLIVDNYSGNIYTNSIELAKFPTLKGKLIVYSTLLTQPPITEFSDTNIPHFTNLMMAANLGYHKIILNYINYYKKRQLNVAHMLNAQDYTGNTALHYAISNSESFETVQILTDHGANFDITNNENITPAQLLDHLPNTPKRNLLTLATLKKDKSSILNILITDIINLIIPYLTTP